MGIVAGLITMLCWGIAIFIAATISRKIGNTLTLFWMQLFGWLMGLAYFVFNFPSLNIAQLPQSLPVLLAIAALQIIAYLSFYKGMEKGQVSLVSPLGATWGLITAILGVAFYHETLGLNQLVAILLIVTGIVLLSIDIQAISKSKQVELLSGVKEGIISMLGWGIAWFLMVIPTNNLDWFMPAFVFRLFLLIMLSIYIATTGKSFLPPKKKFPLWPLLAVGALDMGAFFSLSLGMTATNSSIIAPIASSNTVVTILLARIFLREKLKPAQIGGIVGIITGIVLMSL